MSQQECGIEIKKCQITLYIYAEVEIESRKCIFENDEILIYHAIGSFPDGAGEAVLNSCLLKDEQIWRQENGAKRSEKQD